MLESKTQTIDIHAARERAREELSLHIESAAQTMHRLNLLNYSDQPDAKKMMGEARHLCDTAKSIEIRAWKLQILNGEFPA